MYKGFVVYNNYFKFNPIEHKDKQETNSKDYDTIRKLVKGTDLRRASCPVEGYARRSPCGVKPTKKNNISGIIYQW